MKEVQAPVMDLKARLLLKMNAASALAMTSSSSAAPSAAQEPPAPPAAVSKAKTISKAKATLDLCSSDESETEAVRGMNSLSLSSKPAPRKPAVKKAAYDSDSNNDDDDAYEGEEEKPKKEKVKAVRKPRAPAAVKPQGVKRPNKASSSAG